MAPEEVLGPSISRSRRNCRWRAGRFRTALVYMYATGPETPITPDRTTRSSGGAAVAQSGTAQVYDRAGFGRPVERGGRPAVVVVDFSYGFTDPRYATGTDMTGAVLATAR